ncbi:NAD(P)-binding protein [Butyrivibrio sp. AE2032]|uniref:NAD(P)-binding protein n=1 Tax=Butyrivibrio sp. AE2032 TaxID=1458463 RepID=UPI00054F7281|nr:FAD-dependent oxidoreductase [Butyrivibrio sp. AE2032]
MGTNNTYDKIIIGGGLYGLYAATFCGKRGEKVLVLEYDDAPFKRATYINQARVHMGYHYPRSLSTALKSAGYYRRFHEDYGFSIHEKFKQIYATSGQFSWTNGEQFKDFCKAAGIYCKEEAPSAYFKDGAVDGAFLTEEDTYDAMILRDYFLDEIAKLPGVELQLNARLGFIHKLSDRYEVGYGIADENTGSHVASAPFVLNATYASCNQILKMVEDKTGSSDDDFKSFGIKYELCEIILCKPSKALEPYGFTVMDGPFFSIMPFGKTGYHSLTSVTFTPHVTSYDEVPKFSCQIGTDCKPEQLCNCNDCPNKPASAFDYMSHLAEKYLLPEYGYTYEKSLFSMKPILKSSEVDDSRPTTIRVSSTNPTFVSVLSGKINTVYDLDEYLK